VAINYSSSSWLETSVFSSVLYLFHFPGWCKYSVVEAYFKWIDLYPWSVLIFSSVTCLEYALLDCRMCCLKRATRWWHVAFKMVDCPNEWHYVPEDPVVWITAAAHIKSKAFLFIADARLLHKQSKSSACLFVWMFYWLPLDKISLCVKFTNDTLFEEPLLDKGLLYR
jgi:hypothetical protein